MELQALRQLRAVAEHGTISKAARALQISQPTLTLSIKRLEARLETTLLLRDNRGVKLTGSGRILIDAAVAAMELLERAETEIRALEEEDVGRFTLGCHESLGAYFLPTLMRQMLSHHPGIEVDLKNGSSAWVKQAVLERDIDFGLAVNPEPHDDLVMVRLFRDEVTLFVATTEGAARSLAEARRRTRRGPMIYAGRISQCRDLVARCVSDGFMPDRRLECGDWELVKSLAAAELGVALLPRRVALNGDEGRLVALHEALPSFPDTIFLLYRSDMHRTRAALTLKDALVAHGRRLDQHAHSPTR